MILTSHMMAVHILAQLVSISR